MIPTPKPISIVFLDTEVFVAAAFNFKSAPFEALLKHFKSGRLRLLTTDVTLNEVHSNITEEVHKELTAHAGFIKKARFLKSVSLPEVVATITTLPPDMIIGDISSGFHAFMNAGRALNADVASLKAGPVFAKYFSGTPPFGGATNKKFEFPDAFVLEAIGNWAESREEFVFVVSGDELLREGCKKFTGLVPKSDLAELLDILASEEDQRAQFVRSRIKDNLNKISGEAGAAFEDNYFWVEDNEGEATVVVQKITLAEEPEILSIDSDFGTVFGTVQLQFEAEYTAHLDYRDSSTSIFDKETDLLIYAEDRQEEVHRKVKLKVEVEVSFDEDDPELFTIESVTLVSPSSGFGIKTSESYDWPYK